MNNDKKYLHDKINKIKELGELKSKKQIEINNISKQKNLLETEENEIDEKLKNEKEKLKEEKSKIGSSIREIIDLLKGDLNEFKNFGIKELKSISKSIKDMGVELEEKIIIFELLSNGDMFDDIIKNEEEKIETVKMEQSFIYEEKDYILNPNLQFSKYNLNDKNGFSLKSFAEDYSNEIRKVYEHYNGEIEKTVRYLQKNHGLCNGSIIQNSSFQQVCADIIRENKQINVFINNIKVRGSTNTDILKNVIMKVGVSNVYYKCKEIFNKSFEISEDRKIHASHIKIEKLIDRNRNKTYYIKYHVNTSQILEIIEKIKEKLNANIICV